MYRPFSARSVKRARWIAELNAALVRAEALLAQVEIDHGRCAETVRLAVQIRVIRSELEGMTPVTGAKDRVMGQFWPQIELADEY